MNTRTGRGDRIRTYMLSCQNLHKTYIKLSLCCISCCIVSECAAEMACDLLVVSLLLVAQDVLVDAVERFAALPSAAAHDVEIGHAEGMQCGS